MQCTPFRVVKFIPIECSGFHSAWLNAVVHEVWRNGTLLNAVDFMQRHSMQWISCSMIECSRFYAAWPKASQLNAEYSMPCGAMDPDCMQWSPCSEAQCIPIECSVFYAAWPKASRWNAVDSMQRVWMQCTPFRVVKFIPIECSGSHSAWLNAVFHEVWRNGTHWM